jgi:hypothetical protein
MKTTIKHIAPLLAAAAIGAISLAPVAFFRPGGHPETMPRTSFNPHRGQSLQLFPNDGYYRSRTAGYT